MAILGGLVVLMSEVTPRAESTWDLIYPLQLDLCCKYYRYVKHPFAEERTFRPRMC
jgi:hypothetical protein